MMFVREWADRFLADRLLVTRKLFPRKNILDLRADRMIGRAKTGIHREHRHSDLERHLVRHRNPDRHLCTRLDESDFGRTQLNMEIGQRTPGRRHSGPHLTPDMMIGRMLSQLDCRYLLDMESGWST
tara:strand:- start:809 stop:1189 length:381 start_codon:yes stop_codon:yes gene_type:complete